MLKVEKMVTMSPEQWEIVIEGMRNPHDSWDRMDSYMTFVEDSETMMTAPFEFFVGEADQKLMENLRDGGPVHAKYRRMMPIWMTITAPLYWWKEFDTYKVGTVCNSCSTMHRIHAKEFTLDDFSCEHLVSGWAGKDINGTAIILPGPTECFENTIAMLNRVRESYLSALKTESETGLSAKDIWWQMIQLLPSSYNQKRTVKITYEVAANMRKWRTNHKLDEWRTLCQYLVDNLPYVELTDEEDVTTLNRCIQDNHKLVREINELKMNLSEYEHIIADLREQLTRFRAFMPFSDEEVKGEK